MNHYAGLDVSMESTSICIVDEKGKIIREGEVLSKPELIAKFLVQSKLSFEVVGLESGPISHFLMKELLEYEFPMKCIDARHLHAFLAVKCNKTDKNDARGIAEALRCKAYKEVHHKSDESVAVNAVVNLRESLVEARVKLTNSIRGVLKPFGVRNLGSSVSLPSFLKRCYEALEDLPQEVCEGCEPLFDSLKKIYESIKALDTQLKGMTISDERAHLLMTAPGVGPVVALRFLSAIDEVGRFSNAKAIGAYFGLTPTQYASGEICRQGRVSKRGSKRMRRALFEAAAVLLTRSKKWCSLKYWGMKISRSKGYKKAVVAVARKLSVILYKMLEKNEEFNYKTLKAA